MTLTIEKINSKFENLEFIENVTVIFCAVKTGLGTVIVGWYDHATVYRDRQFKTIEKQKHEYNIKTLQKNAHLIDEDQRKYVVGRATSVDAGFGRSNIWYANQSKDREACNKALIYIRNFEDKSEEKMLADVERTKEYLEIPGLEDTEKEILAKIRIGQGAFRDRLLERYKHCQLCNAGNKALLNASHIKPWSKSKPEERLDTDNGFLLCPNHDRLFDKGMISFEDDGSIMISKQLDDNDRLSMGVSSDMKISLTEKNKEYLKYHRKHIFKNN